MSEMEGDDSSLIRRCCCYRLDNRTIHSGNRVVNIHNNHHFIKSLRIFGYLLSIAGVVAVGSFSKDEKIRLTMLALLILSTVVAIVFRLRNKIRRFCFGKRKSTASHPYSLDEILKRLFSYIPDETQLTEIDEKARVHIAIVQEVVQSQKEQLEIYRESDLEAFLSGSTAERFNLPVSPCWVKTAGVSETSHAIVSDFDYMISPKEETVSFTSSSKKYFADTSDPMLDAGFVKLIDNINGQVISAKSLKENLLSIISGIKLTQLPEFELGDAYCYNCCTKGSGPNYIRARVKGPAIEMSLGTTMMTADRFFSDLTFAIKCQWPDTVSNWTYRPDKLWPDPYNIARIASYGSHLVPKSQPDDKDEVTWRISFSKAEVELSKLVPATARMCLIGLKIIAKDYLSVACSKISSYQLKCLLFCTLERTDPQFWLQEANLTQCFHLLLANLLSAFTTKHCAHFWIPHINLFDNLSGRDCKKLTKVLRKVIRKSPEQFIEEFKPLDNDSSATPGRNEESRPIMAQPVANNCGTYYVESKGSSNSNTQCGTINPIPANAISYYHY